jgi:transcriptional regulator with GAF, ATPase, and Fis domain
MGILRVLSGKTTEIEYRLGDEITIGRGEESEIRIFDETSSRRHARIRREGERWSLEDLGSSNGTSLNDSRIEKAWLSDGDEITVGDVRFRFHLQTLGSRDTVLVDSPSSLQVHSTLEVRSAPSAGPPGAEADEQMLRKTLEIQSLFAGTLDPDVIMERLCQALLDHVGGDRSAVLSASRNGSFEPLAVQRAAGSEDLSFILSRAVVADVVGKKRALLISDSSSDPQFQGSESLISQNVASAICVPVVEEARVAALIYIDRTGPGEPFTERDLHFAVAIAEQASPAIRNARTFSALSQRAKDLEKSLHGELDIIARAPSFLSVVEMARQVAQSDSTVLITGETGTGKEVIARLIHLHSRRKGKPFVPVNCAALVGTLLESEIFGHEKGAFTGAAKRKPGRFELADGGTIFLDEIGEMATEVQAKLLRALQEKVFFRVGGTVPVEVDIRIIAATNRDLLKRIDEGGFRKDLYYRLSVVTLEVPPLRERREDIPDLAEHFLQKAIRKTAREVEGFAPEAVGRLRDYGWPGNVRELENVVERAVVLTREPVIGPELFPLDAGTQSPSPRVGAEVMTLKEAERLAIEAALRHTGWKKGEAAKVLGISWPTLNKKIQDYGIEKE